jgi:hypothetical protein
LKVLDFLRHTVGATRIEESPLAPPVARPEPLEERTPEDLIEGPWAFRESYRNSLGAPVYDSAVVQNAAAIYSAQQMRRIADDVELIRKHLTRLQLVTPPKVSDDEPPAA